MMEIMSPMKAIYPASGTVSIWIGAFDSEEEFDQEVDHLLVPALNLPCEIAAICETTFESQPASIRTLLTGFSGDSTFLDSAIRAAESMGVESATAAIVCYHLAVENYLPLGRLVFLGSHSGNDR
jgi:hypothetical protein